MFVRYARWRACLDSLTCWTRLALANEKEGERWRKDLTWKVKTTLQSFAASTDLECEIKDKSNSVVGLQKKNLSSLSCQWAAEEGYTTASNNNGVVLSNTCKLFRWASKSEDKRTCFDAGLPWGKRKSRLLWLFRGPNIFFALRFSAVNRMQNLNSEKFDRRRIWRQMWNMYQYRISFSHKSHKVTTRRSCPQRPPLTPGAGSKTAVGRSIYIYIVTESQVNT